MKFGNQIAANLRRSRTRPNDCWHLDEMVIFVRGERYLLWRAVDIEGEVLDFLVQKRRDARAAKRLTRKLLRNQGFTPSRIVTDKLRSYQRTFFDLGLSTRHDRGLRANNRAENSHQPVRRRERKQQGFKSPGSAQRFLSIRAATYNTFNVQRHRLSRRSYKILRSNAFEVGADACKAA